MASWPTTLPSPLLSGYGISPSDQVIRTEMEGGETRSRRRSSARKDSFPVSWKFTDAQMAIFRAWFDSPSYADGGNAWFTVYLATGDTGIDSVTARFNGAWQASMESGLHWNVSATLEVRYA